VRAQTSPDTLHNCLRLLKMLSQEIIEFSDDNRTTSQTAEMTAAFHAELPEILPLLHSAL
jgi:hypothetical protein